MSVPAPAGLAASCALAALMAAASAVAAPAAPAAPAPDPAALTASNAIPSEWAPLAKQERDAAAAALRDYGVVDAAKGVYRIPVAVAMDQLARDAALLAPKATVDLGTVTDPAQRGELLFNQVHPCATCHSVDGSAKIGPTIKGIWGHSVELQDGTTVTVDEAYVVESIRNPMAKVVKGFAPAMPPFPQLTDDDIAAVIAYIKKN